MALGHELTRHLEARRWEDKDVEASRRIRRGWCFWGNEFRQGLLEQVDQQRGPKAARNNNLSNYMLGRMA